MARRRSASQIVDAKGALEAAIAMHEGKAEVHKSRAAEGRELKAKVDAFIKAARAPSASTPPMPVTPPSAAPSEKGPAVRQRRWREKKRKEAEAAALKVPPAIAEPPTKEAPDIAPDAPADAVAVAEVAANDRPGAFSEDKPPPASNGATRKRKRKSAKVPPTEMALSAWEVDTASGIATRELRGSGERQILRGEEPLAR
jgi:hypothetical protein